MDEIQALQNKGSAVANRKLLKIMHVKNIDKSVMEDILEKVAQPHLMQYFFQNVERKIKKKNKHKLK